MNTVWKYELEDIPDYVDVEMQVGARILSVQQQNNVLFLWCAVDTEVETETRRFRVAGTGDPIIQTQFERNYIGSVQTLGGRSVAHVFEVGR